MVLFTTVEAEATVFFFGPISGFIFEAIVIAAALVFIFFVLKTMLYLRSCSATGRAAVKPPRAFPAAVR